MLETSLPCVEVFSLSFPHDRIVSYRDIQESADAKLLAQIKEAEESKKAKLDVEQSLIDHMSQILVVDDEGEEDEEESAPVRELSVVRLFLFDRNV